MATIDFSAVTETTQQASGATYVVTLPASGTYAVGDLLMIFLYNAGGGTTISQNGGADWTVVTGQTQTTNIRTAVIYKKAGSTSETNPTFNIANNTVNAVSWVVKNVDGTTQVEASSIATAGSATSVASAATSSVSDNALVFFCGGHSSTNQLRFKSSQATAINANVNLFANYQTQVAFRQMGALGSVPTTTLYGSGSANMQLWTIVIKNSSGGAMMPWCDSGLNELVWYGSHGAPGATITNAAPSNFASGAQINGIDTSAAAATMTTGTATLDWGYYTGYVSTETLSKWVGNYHTYTFPDLTGKVLSFEWSCDQPATAAQIGTAGHIVGITDGTNIAVWQIAAKATGAWVAGQWERVTIEPGVTSTYYTAGTAATAISGATGILFATLSNGTAGQKGVRVRNLVVFDKATIVGGGASYPATWEAAYRALTSCGFYKIARKQAASQYQFDCSVQIGDGSIATYFLPSPQAFEMSPPYNSKTQPWWRVAADKISLTIKAKASDTINLSASSLVTTQSALLSLDAASSTTANYNLQSLLVVGFNVTWSAAEDLTGATFKSGKTVNIAGAGTWTDAIVNSTASANASMSVTANGHVFDGQTIDGTGAAYALELGTSVTAITLANCPITAGSTDKVHVLATTGTVTITISGSTSLVAGDVTSAGATVVIAAPELYQSVVVNGFTAGSRLQIYDVDYNFTVTGVTTYPAAGQTYEDLYGRVYTVISSGAGAVHAYGVTSPKLTGTLTLTKTSAGTGDATITYTACSDDGTELFNGTASAGNTVISGSTATWTDNVAASATRYIRLRRSYVTASTASEFLEQIIGTCGITEGTETVTYLDSPVTDESYETNGIDGSTVTTVTFTDAATDLVNCNVPGGSITWQSIYAAFVYYFFTATGIADDIAYAESPDTANYLFTSTKVKNTSSGPVVPLTITGGYGRDVITGLSSDIIDTSGGSIFLAPDHVVAYATGSGALTAGDITNIWANSSRTLTTTIPAAADNAAAVLTAAQSTPIYADARKMNGATITGTGVDSDLWRGA